MNKLLLIILIFGPLLVHGQIKVRSFIQPLALSLEDTLTLTVEVEYESSAHINSPRLPHLSGFQLLSQSQSHQIQIINGERTNKKQFQYTLAPQKEGIFRIEPIEVIVDGQIYKTSPQKEIEVSSKIKPQPQPQPQPRSFPFGWRKGKDWSPFFSDPFFKEKPFNQEDIFLKLAIDKTKAYVGEMILAEWFFYMPQGSHSFNTEVNQSPSLNGFWVESVFQLGPRSPSHLERTEIKGRAYLKQKLIAKALFPIQEGRLTIGALKAKNWFSGFSSFFGRALKPLLKESQTQSIDVIPLPEEGKGAFWTSAVGDFTVSVELSQNIVSVKEPVIYKVHFKGTGHPRWIQWPPLDFGPHLTVYDVTESQQFELSESWKTFEVILLPNKVGDWLTPSFELSTFDPALGVYKTHILPALKLKVTGIALPDLNKNKSQPYFTDKKEVKSQKSDLLSPQTLHPWVKQQPNLLLKHRTSLWLSIYGFLLILFMLSLYKIYFFKKRKKCLRKNIKARLKQAHQAIKCQDGKQAGQALRQAMIDFFSDLLEQEVAIKNTTVLLKHLPPYIRTKHEETIHSLITQLEKLSFAPKEETKTLQNPKKLKQLKKTLQDMMIKISKDLKAIE